MDASTGKRLSSAATLHGAAIVLVCSVFAGCTGEPTGIGASGGSGAALGSGTGATIGAGAGSGATVGVDPSMASGAAPTSGNGSQDGVGNSTSVEEAVSIRFGLAARLSKFEYQNSVFDVLGVSLLPEELDDAAGGIPDDTGDGVFKHLADNQTSVEQHALAYFQVAEAVAKRADLAQLIERAGICSDASEVCGRAFIQHIGRRLYRRTLRPQEEDAMLSVYRAGLDENLDHFETTRFTLMALLSAPQFLFRMQDETGGVPEQPRELDGNELAARLASFLWVSVPDDALLELAADQSLVKPEVLEAQVARMLADPKARRFTEIFAVDFSRARFASFEGATDADRLALNESLVATFQDHFWSQEASVADLFTTTRFVVNKTVAELLGVSIAGDQLEVVDVAALPERVGLMSHPGIIAGMGDRETGSFVNRGKYLLERLMCRNPAAFPSAITSEIEEFNAETTGLNEHERAEIRMTRAVCWNCHKQFEPLAFGFSRFDGAGRYVGAVDADDKPLPLEGWVPTGEQDEPQYMDVASYMQILATNPVVQTCMTEHFIDFATSRNGDKVGRAAAENVGHEYLSNGSTLSAMVLAVVKSPLFRTILTSSSGNTP